MKRVEGVQDADVSYETGRGVVVYDAAKTSSRAFIEELERLTGFTAVVVSDREDDARGGRARRPEAVDEP